MIKALKQIWAGWKRFALKLAMVQTYILVSLMYVLIVPFFSLIRLADPLRLRPGTRTSFWMNRARRNEGMTGARRQY
jgi:hypothetical protein